MSRIHVSRRTQMTGAAVLSVGFLLASLPGTGPASAAEEHPQEAPVYKVVQEGMTVGQAREFAARAKVGLALRPDGSFSYVNDKRFAKVPEPGVPVKKRAGRDEDKRRTVAQAVNIKALRKTKVISNARALLLAQRLMVTPEGFEAKPRVDHTRVDISNKRGKLVSRTNIDTTVTYSLSLGGVPVVGPGAKQRIAFAGDGSVVQAVAGHPVGGRGRQRADHQPGPGRRAVRRALRAARQAGHPCPVVLRAPAERRQGVRPGLGGHVAAALRLQAVK